MSARGLCAMRGIGRSLVCKCSTCISVKGRGKLMRCRVTYKTHGNGSEFGSGPFDVHVKDEYNQDWEVNGKPFLVRFSKHFLLREVLIFWDKIEMIV